MSEFGGFGEALYKAFVEIRADTTGFDEELRQKLLQAGESAPALPVKANTAALAEEVRAASAALPPIELKVDTVGAQQAVQQVNVAAMSAAQRQALSGALSTNNPAAVQALLAGGLGGGLAASEPTAGGADTAPTTPAERSARNAGTRAGQQYSAGMLGSAVGGLKNFALLGAGFYGLTAGVGFIKSGLDQTEQYDMASKRLHLVLGDQAKDLQGWTDAQAHALGTSQTDLLTNTDQYANLIQQTGKYTNQQVADQTKELDTITARFATQAGVTFDEAQARIQQFIGTGMGRGLGRFLEAITPADLQKEAVKQGIAERVVDVQKVQDAQVKLTDATQHLTDLQHKGQPDQAKVSLLLREQASAQFAYNEAVAKHGTASKQAFDAQTSLQRITTQINDAQKPATATAQDLAKAQQAVTDATNNLKTAQEGAMPTLDDQQRTLAAIALLEDRQGALPPVQVSGLDRVKNDLSDIERKSGEALVPLTDRLAGFLDAHGDQIASVIGGTIDKAGDVASFIADHTIAAGSVLGALLALHEWKDADSFFNKVKDTVTHLGTPGTWGSGGVGSGGAGGVVKGVTTMNVEAGEVFVNGKLGPGGGGVGGSGGGEPGGKPPISGPVTVGGAGAAGAAGAGGAEIVTGTAALRGLIGEVAAPAAVILAIDKVFGNGPQRMPSPQNNPLLALFNDPAGAITGIPQRVAGAAGTVTTPGSPGEGLSSNPLAAGLRWLGVPGQGNGAEATEDEMRGLAEGKGIPRLGIPPTASSGPGFLRGLEGFIGSTRSPQTLGSPLGVLSSPLTGAAQLNDLTLQALQRTSSGGSLFGPDPGAAASFLAQFQGAVDALRKLAGQPPITNVTINNPLSGQDLLNDLARAHVVQSYAEQGMRPPSSYPLSVSGGLMPVSGGSRAT